MLQGAVGPEPGANAGWLRRVPGLRRRLEGLEGALFPSGAVLVSEAAWEAMGLDGVPPGEYGALGALLEAHVSGGWERAPDGAGAAAVGAAPGGDRRWLRGGRPILGIYRDARGG